MPKVKKFKIYPTPYITDKQYNDERKQEFLNLNAPLAMNALIQRDHIIDPDACARKSIAFASALFEELNKGYLKTFGIN